MSVKLMHIKSLKVKIPWFNWSAGVEIELDSMLLVVQPLKADHWSVDEARRPQPAVPVGRTAPACPRRWKQPPHPPRRDAAQVREVREQNIVKEMEKLLNAEKRVEKERKKKKKEKEDEDDAKCARCGADGAARAEISGAP